MPLPWIKRAQDSASLDDLIGGGEYGKAIDLMRAEFSRRYPSTTERRRYAEVLIRAGRGAEAVPVLLGIADEQERYGFPDKALEALRCAATIEPEQSEVKERLESIGSIPPAPADAPQLPAKDAPSRVETLAGSTPGGIPNDERELDGERAAVLEPTSPNHGPGPDTRDPEEPELVVVETQSPEPMGPSHEAEPAALDPEDTVPTPSIDEREVVAIDAEDLEPVDADAEDTVPTPSIEELGLVALDAEDPEPTRPSQEQAALVTDALEPIAADARPPEPARRHGTEEAGQEDLLLPAEDLEPEEVEELTAEDGPGIDDGGGASRFALENDARALLAGSAPEADALGPIVSNEDLERALTADARALLSDGPTEDEPGSAEGNDQRDAPLVTDARALLSDRPRPDGPARLAAADAPSLSAQGPEGPEPRPARGKLDQILAADVRALFPEASASRQPEASPPGGRPKEEPAADAPDLRPESRERDGLESPARGGDRDEALTPDARDLLSGGHPDETHLFLSEDDLFGSALADGPESPPEENAGEGEPDTLVRALAETGAPDRPTLGSLLFADLPREELRGASEGLHRRTYAPGDIVIREGDPGHSVFLIAAGSVRILVMGGHGQPFEIRRIDAGDFFGEVAALSGKPRSATVVAATPCEMLEIDRGALDTLVALRPAARPLLDDTWATRALSPEETAIRSLPPEAADPRQAAEALRAQFAGADWSPRVRLYLSRMMLEAGRAGDALATLAGVAEDLAQRGHAKGAIAILKKAGRFRHRGSDEPTEDAAFRERVESLLSEATELAARATTPVEEVAERAGEEQGDQLAG